LINKKFFIFFYFLIVDIKVQKDFENQMTEINSEIKRSKSMSIYASKHLEKRSSDSTIYINVNNGSKTENEKLKVSFHFFSF
jgi:hypothetical protein